MKRIIACLLLIAPLTANADSWLCIGDKATGFNLKDGAWEETNFNPSRYLIKPAEKMSNDLMGAVFQVHVFGDKNPGWVCLSDLTEDGRNNGFLDCRGFVSRGSTFKYNQNTGHFLATETMGYVEILAGKVVEDSPSIEIGKCSKL